MYQCGQKGYQFKSERENKAAELCSVVQTLYTENGERAKYECSACNTRRRACEAVENSNNLCEFCVRQSVSIDLPRPFIWTVRKFLPNFIPTACY